MLQSFDIRTLSWASATDHRVIILEGILEEQLLKMRNSICAEVVQSDIDRRRVVVDGQQTRGRSRILRPVRNCRAVRVQVVHEVD